MPDTIPSLWPSDIHVDVLTPVALPRAQAGLLGKMTKGVLKAEVSTLSGESKRVRHHLDLVAPALGFYRHRILTASHHSEFVYPVEVDAECFQEGGSRTLTGVGVDTPHADSEKEFLDLVARVLQSPEVLCVALSLLARSNEQRQTQTEAAATNPETDKS